MKRIADQIDSVDTPSYGNLFLHGTKMPWKTARGLCPYCHSKIYHRIPEKEEGGNKGFWDSSCICPHCTFVYWKEIHPSGKLIILSFSDEVQSA